MLELHCKRKQRRTVVSSSWLWIFLCLSLGCDSSSWWQNGHSLLKRGGGGVTVVASFITTTSITSHRASAFASQRTTKKKTTTNPPERPLLSLSSSPYFTNDYSVNNNNNNNNDHDDYNASKELRHRVHHLGLLMDIYPPSPNLTATEFCRHLIRALSSSSSKRELTTSVRALFFASTPSWRKRLYRAVGASSREPLDIVIGTFANNWQTQRKETQFSILLKGGCCYRDLKQQEKHDYFRNNDDVENPLFYVEFPSEPVDYGDGKCWVECRLRSRQDDSLWVIMGWSLERDAFDGSWKLDSMDWHDFRDEFRPGIGQEEWERICG